MLSTKPSFWLSISLLIFSRSYSNMQLHFSYIQLLPYQLLDNSNYFQNPTYQYLFPIVFSKASYFPSVGNSHKLQTFYLFSAITSIPHITLIPSAMFTKNFLISFDHHLGSHTLYISDGLSD